MLLFVVLNRLKCQVQKKLQVPKLQKAILDYRKNSGIQIQHSSENCEVIPPSTKMSHSLYQRQKGQIVVCVTYNLTQIKLVSRIPQYHKYLLHTRYCVLKLLTYSLTLDIFQLTGLSSPNYSSTHFLSPPHLSLPSSTLLMFLTQSSLVCWLYSVYFYLSFLLNLPDGSDCSLKPSLNYTMEESYIQ